jgi:LacI family fructose operon transcriptional repressor
LEGALRFTSKLSISELQAIVVGTFDWDPFAAHLPFDVTMMRQNVEVMIAEGFALIDSNGFDRNALVVVPTSFGKLGELDGMQEDWDERDTASPQEDALPGKGLIHESAVKSVR